MKFPHSPIHFPGDSPEGPWGVDSVGDQWYIVNRTTLQCKRIGRVIGFKPVGRSRPNYFDRAMAEAHRRNLKEK